jgi:hypothetical protein
VATSSTTPRPPSTRRSASVIVDTLAVLVRIFPAALLAVASSMVMIALPVRLRAEPSPSPAI